MLSFYPAAAHSRYSARPLYSDDIIHLHPASISGYSYHPRTTNPESRYRRALAEYLVAEEELFRSREEATWRARAEAFQRQEEARLLQARTIRAREERKVQLLKQLLAQQRAAVLAAKTAVPEVHSRPLTGSLSRGVWSAIGNLFPVPQSAHIMGEDQLFDSIPKGGMSYV
jgi:hypothetical protein